MFQSSEQRARVCAALCAAFTKDSEQLWVTEPIPMPTVTAVDLRSRAALSVGEHQILLFAFAVWNGASGADYGKMSKCVDEPNMRRIGYLIAAIATGPDAIEAWLISQTVDWLLERGGK